MVPCFQSTERGYFVEFSFQYVFVSVALILAFNSHWHLINFNEISAISKVDVKKERDVNDCGVHLLFIGTAAI